MMRPNPCDGVLLYTSSTELLRVGLEYPAPLESERVGMYGMPTLFDVHM